jgi:hypothetical protein
VGLKLNGTHQLLAYAHDVNLLGDNADNIKKNTETLIDSSMEVGLEINVEKYTIFCLELDGIVAYSGYYHAICLECLRKITKNSISSVSRPSSIGVLPKYETRVLRLHQCGQQNG